MTATKRVGWICDRR